jgi:hypothetical protein
MSMLLVDFLSFPVIGQGGGIVTHWGADSPWVMNGGKSFLNYLKSGMLGKAKYSSGVEKAMDASNLAWPKGWEWVKGFLGQRVVK